jgi:hypothetical protein
VHASLVPPAELDWPVLTSLLYPVFIVWLHVFTSKDKPVIEAQRQVLQGCFAFLVARQSDENLRNAQRLLAEVISKDSPGGSRPSIEDIALMNG